MKLSLHVSVSELTNTKELFTTAEFRRNAIIPCMLLESFETVCSQGPEPRVSDGWQDSMELPPSMQYQTLYRTAQHLESRNHQSSD